MLYECFKTLNLNKKTRTILTILVISFFAAGVYLEYKLSETQKYNLRHDIETYKLGHDDGFKLGYKEGIIESQTALRQTKDLSNRDKVLYWEWMKERAGVSGIELVEK